MAARMRLNVTSQYIVCAADILCRFPSSLCGLFTFRGASYRTDICLRSRNLLNAVSTSKAKFAVQFPGLNCKLCFEHYCNLFVPGFVKRLIILLTRQGKASVGLDGFVIFVDKSSQLPVSCCRFLFHRIF